MIKLVNKLEYGVLEDVKYSGVQGIEIVRGCVGEREF